MDFGTLIHVAQKNTSEVKSGNFYKAKFEPPKKESKEKRLSANIRKFLAEKQKEEEDAKRAKIKKSQELMAKRDSKEKNKIAKMLKVTKSANKSVLEDAVDNDNTALTLEPEQPDEDDYGYTSLESGNLYKKLMEKYSKLPDEEKFSKSSGKHKMSHEDMQKAKNRVKEAIMREKEEQNAPHKRTRKSKHKEDSYENDEVPYEPEKERHREEKVEEKVKKKKFTPAPIVDFNQLLKLAAEKQHEPVEIEVPMKKKEPERLMTTKERREHMEREAYFKAKEIRDRNRESGKAIPESIVKSSGPKELPRGFINGKIPKLNGSTSSNSPGPSSDKNKSKPASTSKIDRNDKSQFKVPSTSSSSQNGQMKPSSSSSSSLSHSSSKLYAQLSKPLNSKEPATKNKPSDKSLASRPTEKSRESTSKDMQRKVAPSSSSSKDPKNLKPRPSTSAQKSREPQKSSKEVQKSREIPQKTREFPPRDIPKSREIPQKTREFPPRDLQKTREFPPRDLQKTREFPPRDVQRSRDIRRPAQGPPMSSKRRNVIEDEDSEYDSEMDDFIDDGDEELDYSSEIKRIFGYDKSRYKDEDFDDRQMESNFATVMREEYISKKIGIMEDLEDMKQEALEKKQKDKMRAKRRRLD